MIQLLGLVSAICFAISYVPQICKTQKRKKVDDLSLWLWLLNFAAYSCGLAYGIGIKEWPLIINYTNGLVCGGIILIQYGVYKE